MSDRHRDHSGRGPDWKDTNYVGRRRSGEEKTDAFEAIRIGKPPQAQKAAAPKKGTKHGKASSGCAWASIGLIGGTGFLGGVLFEFVRNIMS